jgi:flagellar biosynthetic protein FliR
MDLSALDTSALLAALPAWAFSFMLVLCRCGSAVMLLPGLGEAEPPAALRAGLSIGLVVLILPGVGVVQPPGPFPMLAMVGAELLCGGVLGWLARCITLALPMAGQVISVMLGLTSIVAPDPVLGQSSTIMRMFSLAAPVLVLGTGLWALPVAALAGSYTLVPMGHLLSVTDGVDAAVGAISTAFGLSMRLAAPFVIASTVWQVALGLLSRLIPQLQIYFAAMPGQIIGGLALLAILATSLAEIWVETARESFNVLPGL